jgi:hypothetical protein
MTRAAIVGANLRTYENMDVVYASLADDPTGQQLLVSLWRRHAMSLPITPTHRRRVRNLIPVMWRDHLVMPNLTTFNRWSADHGHVSR